MLEKKLIEILGTEWSITETPEFIRLENTQIFLTRTFYSFEGEQAMEKWLTLFLGSLTLGKTQEEAIDFADNQ